MRLRRDQVLSLFVVLLLVIGAVWLGVRLRWVEVQVPDKTSTSREPVDRHMALKRLAQRLGTTVHTPPNLDQLPPSGATVMLSSTYWDLFPERSVALRRWVEAGGHLWLPYEGELSKGLRWLPIDWKHLRRAKPHAAAASSADDGDEDDDQPDAAELARQKAERCAGAVEEPADVQPGFEARRSYAMCVKPTSTLTARAPLQWGLRADEGLLVARVAVGRGSVTTASVPMKWSNHELLKSDNGLIATAALRLRPGAELWIVDDEKRPHLPAFLWATGAPAILLGMLALAFALWRGAIRFGPRILPIPIARRSMAEQIRGTARFVANHGSGALHIAARRAFDDTARTHVQGWSEMNIGERARVVAQRTGANAQALASALAPARHSGAAQPTAAALELLEVTRRRLLVPASASSPEPS